MSTTRKMTKARARQLLKSAANAAGRLEATIREMVAGRAWEVLGYENFSEMWERENGFKCSTHVWAVVVYALMDEGLRSKNGRGSGHTRRGIAAMTGLSIKVNDSGRAASADGIMSQIFAQRRCGVPPERATKTSSGRWADVAIDKYGTRKRAQPRRMGKSPTEKVSTTVYLERWMEDEVADIARGADIPKAEIYRQAVAEYLLRHRESRPARQRKAKARAA